MLELRLSDAFTKVELASMNLTGQSTAVTLKALRSKMVIVWVGGSELVLSDCSIRWNAQYPSMPDGMVKVGLICMVERVCAVHYNKNLRLYPERAQSSGYYTATCIV